MTDSKKYTAPPVPADEEGFTCWVCRRERNHEQGVGCCNGDGCKVEHMCFDCATMDEDSGDAFCPCCAPEDSEDSEDEDSEDEDSDDEDSDEEDEDSETPIRVCCTCGETMSEERFQAGKMCCDKPLFGADEEDEDSDSDSSEDLYDQKPCAICEKHFFPVEISWGCKWSEDNGADCETWYCHDCQIKSGQCDVCTAMEKT